MHNLTQVWVIGCLVTAAVVVTTTLNAIVAFSYSSNEAILLGLRILLFIAFGLSLAGVFVLSYFTSLYVRNVERQAISLDSTVWTIFAVGASAAGFTLLVPGIAFVWLVSQQKLPDTILQSDPMIWIAAWFAVWGVSVVLETGLFVMLGLWTKQALKKQSVGRLDLDFGIRIPSVGEVGINGSRQSLNSRDTTLASPPRTPTSTRVGSSRHSLSATKATAINSRTKLVGRGSARSSFDLPYSINESTADNAFDRWDTSSVHHEMRAAVGSSPPVTRSGLPTIPGSRPESPADALDGPFLPSSPHATTSDVATAIEYSSSPRQRRISSTPPSSPPNFSRPTSRSQNKSISTTFGQPIQEMIHPLFRASSPHPPPIATMGTTVTASPMANDPITPKTLARLRSNSNTKQTPRTTGHWKAMPSIDATSRRPSTSSSRPGSSGLGSPGPSICEDHELPPILPGFVLSAGSRSSLVNYSARKSMKKEKTPSQSSFRL